MNRDYSDPKTVALAAPRRQLGPAPHRAGSSPGPLPILPGGSARRRPARRLSCRAPRTAAPVGLGAGLVCHRPAAGDDGDADDDAVLCDVAVPVVPEAAEGPEWPLRGIQPEALELRGPSKVTPLLIVGLPGSHPLRPASSGRLKDVQLELAGRMLCSLGRSREFGSNSRQGTLGRSCPRPCGGTPRPGPGRWRGRSRVRIGPANTCGEHPGCSVVSVVGRISARNASVEADSAVRVFTDRFKMTGAVDAPLYRR
jgi:hypothetical protein